MQGRTKEAGSHTRTHRLSVMGGYAVVMVTVGHLFQNLRVNATSAFSASFSPRLHRNTAHPQLHDAE